MKKIKLFLALGLLMTTLSAWAATYDISQSAWQGQTVTTNNNGTYKGTGQVSLKIPAGGTIYLSNIDLTGVNDGTNGYGISCEGNATIYLMNTNKVTSGSPNLPAIYVKPGYTLTITVPSGSENASLTAKCDETAGTGYAAGIGASRDSNCGNIVINGGKVTAIGGRYGAGIGGAYNTNCGTITVTKYATLVTAARGASATCSIGKGYNTSTSGTVTIAELVRPNGITKQSYTYTPWDGNLSTINDDVVAFDGTVITGMFSSSASSKYRVYIAGSATVTLDNAGMPSNVGNNYKWPMLTCLASAKIMLENTNTIGYMNGNYPSIYVPKSYTLTIDSEKSGDYAGELDVTNKECVAIGGGYYLDCGNIIIQGGIITATSEAGDNAAIGSGAYASCGNITITNGVTKLVATCGGGDAPHCIGASHNGTCGTVTIGGVVYPNGVEGMTFTFPIPAWDGDLSKVTSDVVAVDGTIIHGTLNTRHKITIADGATVWLSNANINSDDNTSYVSNGFAALQCEGNATIGLDTKTVNYVKSFCSGWSGIYVPQGKTLTIKGSGKLTAEGVSDAAGIGGPYDTKCGNIIIEDGEIIANGVSGAPGIGGGRLNSCGDITINGGTITATGGIDAVGIGCGYGGTCGKIKISGEVTKLTATRGTHDAEVVYCIGESVSFSTYTSTCGGVWIGDTKVSDKGIKGSLNSDTFVLEPAELSKSLKKLDEEISYAQTLINAYQDAYPAIIAPLAAVYANATSIRSVMWYDKPAVDNAYDALHAACVDAWDEIQNQGQDIPCDPPTDFKVSNVTATSATLSWKPGAVGQITYNLIVVKMGGSPSWYFNEDISVTSFTLTDLEPNTKYEAELGAYCSHGTSDWAAPGWIYFTTQSAQGIDQITNDQSSITNKVLRDGQVIILRNGKTFNVLGTEMK